MSQTQPPTLEREDIGDVTVLRLRARMLPSDESTEKVFAKAYAVVDDDRRCKLILNMNGVDFLASVAIGKLISLMRKARTAGGTLILCSVSPTVAGILHITKLSDIMPVYANEREAVEALK
jgi:anti-anti-sigma factor